MGDRQRAKEQQRKEKKKDLQKQSTGRNEVWREQ